MSGPERPPRNKGPRGTSRNLAALRVPQPGLPTFTISEPKSSLSRLISATTPTAWLRQELHMAPERQTSRLPIPACT